MLNPLTTISSICFRASYCDSKFLICKIWFAICEWITICGGSHTDAMHAFKLARHLKIEQLYPMRLRNFCLTQTWFPILSCWELCLGAVLVAKPNLLFLTSRFSLFSFNLLYTFVALVLMYCGCPLLYNDVDSRTSPIEVTYWTFWLSSL